MVAQERADVSKRITSEESKLEQLRAKLHEVLQRARVEEVALPLLGGSASGGGEGEGGRRRSRRGSGSDDGEKEGEGERGEDESEGSSVRNSQVRN